MVKSNKSNKSQKISIKNNKSQKISIKNNKSQITFYKNPVFWLFIILIAGGIILYFVFNKKIITDPCKQSNCKKGEGCCNINNKAVCYDPTKQTCIGDIQLCDKYKACGNICCTDQQTCNPVKDNDGKIIKMECGPCKNTDTKINKCTGDNKCCISGVCQTMSIIKNNQLVKGESITIFKINTSYSKNNIVMYKNKQYKAINDISNKNSKTPDKDLVNWVANNDLTYCCQKNSYVDINKNCCQNICNNGKCCPNGTCYGKNNELCCPSGYKVVTSYKDTSGNIYNQEVYDKLPSSVKPFEKIQTCGVPCGSNQVCPSSTDCIDNNRCKNKKCFWKNNIILDVPPVEGEGSEFKKFSNNKTSTSTLTLLDSNNYTVIENQGSFIHGLPVDKFYRFIAKNSNTLPDIINKKKINNGEVTFGNLGSITNDIGCFNPKTNTPININNKTDCEKKKYIWSGNCSSDECDDRVNIEGGIKSNYNPTTGQCNVTEINSNIPSLDDPKYKIWEKSCPFQSGKCCINNEAKWTGQVCPDVILNDQTINTECVWNDSKGLCDSKVVPDPYWGRYVGTTWTCEDKNASVFATKYNSKTECESSKPERTCDNTRSIWAATHEYCKDHCTFWSPLICEPHQGQDMCYKNCMTDPKRNHDVPGGGQCNSYQKCCDPNDPSDGYPPNDCT